MQFRTDKEEELSINLTPLIDVVFLLLIFFMVSTTFSKESELNIRLPEAEATKPDQTEQKMVIVEVSAEGVFALKSAGDEESKRLVDSEAQTLMTALKAATGSDRDTVTVIRADRKTPHEFVIRALDGARRLGLTKVTFAAQTPIESASEK